MLLAALNHSYTTNVFKEEILTDVTKERACETPHSKRENMQGTGDMPEAWGNANVVNLLRDMLIQERSPAPGHAGKPTLDLLAGLPASWIVPGQDISVINAPTTLATTVSLKLHPLSSTSMHLTVDPGNKPTNLVIHIPIALNQTVKSILIDGKQTASSTLISIPAASRPIAIEINLSR
jgi:hypothetical protein